MKLPIEVSLHVLGFLGSQSLGLVMLANRRLSGIVIRHRNTLNLPEIPIPPSLSISVKCLAVLAAVMFLLIPIGISHVNSTTRRRLRAAGLVFERFHNVSQGNVSVPCTTMCDSQLKCHAQCAFEYTLLEERKGRITKTNCTSTGLSTANASRAIRVGWNCSFDYTVNETSVDFDLRKRETYEEKAVTFFSVFLAVLALADFLLLIRLSRVIGDAYMAAATDSPRRDRLQSEHENLRKAIVGMFIFALIFAGLVLSAALYGTTFQTFRGADRYFGALLVISVLVSAILLLMSGVVLLTFFCEER